MFFQINWYLTTFPFQAILKLYLKNRNSLVCSPTLFPPAPVGCKWWGLLSLVECSPSWPHTRSLPTVPLWGLKDNTQFTHKAPVRSNPAHEKVCVACKRKTYLWELEGQTWWYGKCVFQKSFPLLPYSQLESWDSSCLTRKASVPYMCDSGLCRLWQT